MRKKALIPKQESVPEREPGPLFQVEIASVFTFCLPLPIPTSLVSRVRKSAYRT